jgi:carboxyl-terminal processing protease
LIIGEPSFGKGTVQTMLNLDQMAHIEKPKFGELKMTIAQFFRINGGTTQLRGVTPDISLPTMTDPATFGESSYDNALPWVQIPAADYRMLGDVKAVLPQLQIRHESRIAKDRDFQFLNEDIAEITAQRKKNMVSLNEVERRKELDTREARTKKRKAQQIVPGSDEGQDDDAPGGKDDGLQAGERSLAVELAAEKSRKNAKDILLNEAAHILSDEVEFLKTDAKLAARVMSGMKPSIAERLAR